MPLLRYFNAAGATHGGGHRGGPPPGEPSDPHRAPGGPGQAGPRGHLRRRLSPPPTAHLHPGLYHTSGIWSGPPTCWPWSYLARAGRAGPFNLGNGTGYSVKEIIETARRVTGKAIPAVVEPRRAGDPSVLIASNKKALEVLGWKLGAGTWRPSSPTPGPGTAPTRRATRADIYVQAALSADSAAFSRCAELWDG